MERIYQNCYIRYTLGQEGGKGRAKDAAAPGSRTQRGEKCGDKTNTSNENIYFLRHPKKIKLLTQRKRNFNETILFLWKQI
jgi:hypothetical protein